MPKLNEAGVALIKHFEGCELAAYQDSAGVWTIGYGSTTDVTPGMTITQAEADARLESDVQTAVDGVAGLCAISINPNQFAALVSFAYNLGVGALAGSTLMRLVNAGNFAEAAQQFGHWVWAGGEVLPGLVTRRAAERKLFETPT